VPFLLGGERAGERAGLQLQGVHQPAEHQPHGCGHSITSQIGYDRLQVHFLSNRKSNSDLAGSLLIKNLELIINNCGIFFENDFNKSQSDTFQFLILNF
jgi:hypothetical protein